VEKVIASKFNEDITNSAAKKYGVSSTDLTKLDSFESYIFKYSKNGIGYILRIAHSIQRSEILIRAEVEWIRYLTANGVSVADAVPSQNGNLVAAIPDGASGFFLVSSLYQFLKHLFLVTGSALLIQRTTTGKLAPLTTDLQNGNP